MRVWVLALVLCACGDDISLRVRVEHPAGVDVALTTVTVYESANVTCSDIAIARIGDAELDAIKVTEESVAKDGETTGELTGISRVDHKIIVARGFSATGEWITAGCAEHDEVDETTKIVIETIPTVTAATVIDMSDTGDPFLAVLAATDMTGKAVADRRVGWTVYGPAGSTAQATNVRDVSDGVWEPAKPSCTESSTGAAELHPPPPNIIGGYSVQLRAEWAVELPALYSRMIANFANRQIQPPNSSKKYCAIRKKGTTARVVCLDNGVARDYEVMVSGGQVTLMQRDMMVLGPDALDVVSVPSGGDRDVYMMSTKGMLVPLFGAPPADNSAAPCTTGCTVDDVIAVPACGTLPGKLIVRLNATGAGQLLQMNARGGGTQEFPIETLAIGAQVQLDNAGCVTRADPGGGPPTLRQVVTYHVGARNPLGEFVAVATRAAYGCNATTCMSNELFPGAGVAFTGGEESRMLVTFVDASGVVIAEVIMAPDKPMRDLFVERSRSPAASIPDRLVVGQYDADTDTDMFWNMSARRGTTFEVAYGRKVSVQRLEALSPVQPITVTGLDSADLTGDGHDDVMAIGDVNGTTASGLVVIPMGAPAPMVSIASDSTCSP